MLYGCAQATGDGIDSEPCREIDIDRRLKLAQVQNAWYEADPFLLRS